MKCPREDDQINDILIKGFRRGEISLERVTTNTVTLHPNERSLLSNIREEGFLTIKFECEDEPPAHE